MAEWSKLMALVFVMSCALWHRRQSSDMLPWGLPARGAGASAGAGAAGVAFAGADSFAGAFLGAALGAAKADPADTRTASASSAAHPLRPE